MTVFLQDREKSFEDKFHHDKELEFKIKSRRNYNFGLWSAEQMGLKKDVAEVYARSLVTLLLQNPDDEVLLNKVLQDFKDLNKMCTPLQLQKQLRYACEDARIQLTGK